MRVSVCIPTYNGELYIVEQLNSIRSQLSQFDEIIISDDCSTDSTIELIESLSDSRIKVFKHEKIINSYLGAYRGIYTVYRNVENALIHASGDFVFLSDQDDIWLPNKVATIIPILKSGVDLVLHDNTVINNEKVVLYSSYFDISKPDYSYYTLFVNCFYQGCSMAFNKEIMKLALPFPNNPISHDHWIAYNAKFEGKEILFLKDKLIYYRRHGNNVSPSAERSNNSLYFKISYRVRLVIAFLIIKLKRRK